MVMDLPPLTVGFDGGRISAVELESTATAEAAVGGASVEATVGEWRGLGERGGASMED